MAEKEETNIGANALLLNSEGELILQLRDNKPDIALPGKITMFGGTIKKSETKEEGLIRELEEELGKDFSTSEVKFLGQFKKTKELDGIDYTVNVFLIENVELDELKLLEGQDFVVGKPEQLLENEKLTRICRLAIELMLKSTHGKA